jgi:hypothetical protein
MISYENRTTPERRAVVDGLRPGDRVALGRDSDPAHRAIADGVIESVTSARFIKVRVGASRITFHPTGLERGSSGGGGHGRGLRVILARLP